MAAVKAIYKKPQLASDSKSFEKLLSDLGKATKRGIKKCPDCGFINGTRCYMCKNPLCNKVLKDADKHKIHIDSVKLLTGTRRQIYSVRIRDKGPDQRGFVQLPQIQYYNSPSVHSEVTLCFVANCKQFDNSILKCHEEYEDVNNYCIHIESAMKSLSTAHAVDFKHHLINHLKVGDEMKKKLCSLAKLGDDPLVQRISKNVMAIKCFVNSKNPLGYLHFTLNFKKCSATSEEEIESFHCMCNGSKKASMEKCLHYYACICAFASDYKLMMKYSSFIQDEFDKFEDLLDGSFKELMDTNHGEYKFNHVRLKSVKSKYNSVHKGLLKKRKVASKQYLKTIQKKVPIKIISNDLIRLNQINQNDAAVDILRFEDWLTSTVEQITYSCLFNYKKAMFELQDFTTAEIIEENLIFHIPDGFFELLKGRIEQATKNYHPELKTVEKDFPPGRFIMLLYNINDISTLNQIFNTRKANLIDVPLFVNYIKPFTVKWTANVMKQSNFGELQLTFNRTSL